MSRPSRTNARSTRATSSGASGVLVGRGVALGLGTRRERERLAEQVVRAVVAAHARGRVDQALQRATRGARVEARCARTDLGDVGRTQHERREHAPPVLVGEEPDQLRRGRTSTSAHSARSR